MGIGPVELTEDQMRVLYCQYMYGGIFNFPAGLIKVFGDRFASCMIALILVLGIWATLFRPKQFRPKHLILEF